MKKIETKRLETDRLILRKFEEDDYKEMFDNWASDEEVPKYVRFKIHKTYDDTKTIIDKWLGKYETGCFNWVAELKETKEIIGNIEVISISERNNNCELGYVFGSKYWGNGYATEIVKKVIDYLFEEYNFHLIEAKHHSPNLASGRVMEKCGMKKECSLRERRYNENTNSYDDLIMYSITKDEWNMSK